MGGGVLGPVASPSVRALSCPRPPPSSPWWRGVGAVAVLGQRPAPRRTTRSRTQLRLHAPCNGDVIRETWMYYPGLDTGANRSPSNFHAAKHSHPQPGPSGPGGTPIRGLHLLEELTVLFGRSAVDRMRIPSTATARAQSIHSDAYGGLGLGVAIAIP